MMWTGNDVIKPCIRCLLQLWQLTTTTLTLWALYALNTERLYGTVFSNHGNEPVSSINEAKKAHRLRECSLLLNSQWQVFPAWQTSKVAVEGNSYGAIQCLKNTTGPTRQCSSHSVNALVQWRGSIEIMLLVNRKNIDKILTALTALVLWRNNYCLRTKMYIVAHDVSVDNCFVFFKLLYFIWY